jgi:hypothetical protein
MGLVPALLTGQPFSHIRANEPFGIDSAVYDAGGDTLTAQMGNGRVRYGATTFELANTGAYTTAVTVTPVVASTTYYVVMDYAAGTPALSFTTVVPAPTSSADFTYIGYVTVDGTKAVTDIVDLRGLLIPTNPRVSDGTAAVPGFAFADAPGTGMYSLGGELAFSYSGASKMKVSNNVLMEDEIQFLADPGTLADPGLSWRGDTNTGFFNSANGGTSHSANGTESALFDYWGVKTVDGTESLPSFSFMDNTNTGMYRPAPNQIGFSTGGSLKMSVVEHVIMNFDVELRVWDGTAATPGINFRDDTNTGFFRVASGDTGYSANGTERVRFDDGGLKVFGSVDVSSSLTVDGTIFGGGSDLALDSGLPADLVFRTDGITRGWYDHSQTVWRWDRSMRPATDSAHSLGTSSAKWLDIWAVDGSINTSDARTKPEMWNTELGLNFIKELNPIGFRRDGRARPHEGFSAQQVKEAMTALGVADFAGYIDPSFEAEARADDPSFDNDNHGPLGLRMTEFIGPIVKAIQELADRLDALEAA